MDRAHDVHNFGAIGRHLQRNADEDQYGKERGGHVRHYPVADENTTLYDSLRYRVAHISRNRRRLSQLPMKAVPWWALAAACAAPILLIGGFLFAATLQPPSYDAVRDTISQLAKQGATDSWIMTIALAGVGVCYMLTALGLRPAYPAGRVLLAGGGVATLLIALFRQPRHGYSVSHELAVIAAAVTCCTWPAFGWRRLHPPLLLARTPGLLAAGVSLALAAWYGLESHGALLGIAERCAAAAPPLWLLAVVVTTRHVLAQTNRGGESWRTIPAGENPAGET
jgi:hypothetical membrane protein